MGSKFVIKIKETQSNLIGLKEGNNYLKSFELNYIRQFKATYGKINEAYIFYTKKLADDIAVIVKGEVIGETQKKVLKQEGKSKWVALNPPSKDEVLKYCKEKDLNLNAEEVYKYYMGVKWKDKSGNEIVNWKLKLQTVSDINNRKGINARKDKGKTVDEAKIKEGKNKEEKIKEIKEQIKANESLISKVKDEKSPIVKRAKEIIEKLNKELKEVEK